MRLFALASICLTVQSTRSPGDGCCMTRPAGGWWFNHTIPFAFGIENAPDGADCDLEAGGVEATRCDGEGGSCDEASQSFYRSYYGNCREDDDKVATYLYFDLDLSNGTSISANIIYHSDGTIEADCGLSTRLASSLLQESDMCMGPKYNEDQVFEGIVSYGSVKAERYSSGRRGSRWMSNDVIDVDADNGCIPIRMSPFTITNWVNSAPPASLFTIPPECLQQGIKATGPVRNSNGFLSSLNAMRGSSVV